MDITNELEYYKKYLKYKKKYIKLVEQYGGNPTFNFFFDWDQTLIPIHTNGSPNNRNVNQAQIDILRDFLLELTKTQHNIFIVSRGFPQKIASFLQTDIFPSSQAPTIVIPGAIPDTGYCYKLTLDNGKHIILYGASYANKNEKIDYMGKRVLIDEVDFLHMNYEPIDDSTTGLREIIKPGICNKNLPATINNKNNTLLYKLYNDPKSKAKHSSYNNIIQHFCGNLPNSYTNNSTKWAYLKSLFIQHAMNNHDAAHNYFFDDTKINVDITRDIFRGKFTGFDFVDLNAGEGGRLDPIKYNNNVMAKVRELTNLSSQHSRSNTIVRHKTVTTVTKELPSETAAPKPSSPQSPLIRNPTLRLPGALVILRKGNYNDVLFHEAYYDIDDAYDWFSKNQKRKTELPNDWKDLQALRAISLKYRATEEELLKSKYEDMLKTPNSGVKFWKEADKIYTSSHKSEPSKYFELETLQKFLKEKNIFSILVSNIELDYKSKLEKSIASTLNSPTPTQLTPAPKAASAEPASAASLAAAKPPPPVTRTSTAVTPASAASLAAAKPPPPVTRTSTAVTPARSSLRAPIPAPPPARTPPPVARTPPPPVTRTPAPAPILASTTQLEELPRSIKILKENDLTINDPSFEHYIKSAIKWFSQNTTRQTTHSDDYNRIIKLYDELTDFKRKKQLKDTKIREYNDKLKNIQDFEKEYSSIINNTNLNRNDKVELLSILFDYTENTKLKSSLADLRKRMKQSYGKL